VAAGPDGLRTVPLTAPTGGPWRRAAAGDGAASALARLEGEIALGRLLHRFDTITLDDRAPAPRYRNSTLMRGLDALPVRLSHS
jgi:hypothetical protein